MRRLALLVALLAALSLGGCIFSLGPIAMSPGAGGKRGSPPPNAPTHGYVHHHPADGMALRFDAQLGVYMVVDLPSHYFFDGLYLRWDQRRWIASTHLDGPWEPHPGARLPFGLRAKHEQSAPGQARGKRGSDTPANADR